MKNREIYGFYYWKFLIFFVYLSLEGGFCIFENVEVNDGGDIFFFISFECNMVDGIEIIIYSWFGFKVFLLRKECKFGWYCLYRVRWVINYEFVKDNFEDSMVVFLYLVMMYDIIIYFFWRFLKVWVVGVLFDWIKIFFYFIK